MQPRKLRFYGAQRRCNSWGSPTSSVTTCSPIDNGSLTNLDYCTVNFNDDGTGGLDFFGPQTRNSLGLGQHQRRRSQAVATTTTNTMVMDTILSERSPPTPLPSAPRVPVRQKQRSCSCSSQTDLSIGSIENLATALAASPAPSLPNLQSLPLGRLERFLVFKFFWLYFARFISSILMRFSFLSVDVLFRTIKQ